MLTQNFALVAKKMLASAKRKHNGFVVIWQETESKVYKPFAFRFCKESKRAGHQGTNNREHLYGGNPSGRTQSSRIAG